MNDQPIIVEQILLSQAKTGSSLIEGELFYKVLDQSQKYDSMATQIRKIHENCMLELAAIKFIDPNSLNANAHRCVPALLKISDELQLNYGYSCFVQKNQEILDAEQLECQQLIENQCFEKQNNQLEKQKQGGQVEESRQTYIEKEIIYRFNVFSQQEKILPTAKHFKNLLQKLIELAKLKYQIDQKFTSLQSLQQEKS